MKPRFHPFVRLLFFGLGSLLASTMLLFVIGIALVVAAMTARRDPTEVTNFLSNNALLTTVFFYPPVLLWLWFCRRAFDRQTFASLGLRLRSSLGSVFSGALCGVLTLGCSSGFCGRAVICVLLVCRKSGPQRVLAHRGFWLFTRWHSWQWDSRKKSFFVVTSSTIWWRG
jgi:hypothetical protein